MGHLKTGTDTHCVLVFVKLQDLKNNSILKVLIYVPPSPLHFQSRTRPHHRDFYAPFSLIPNSVPCFPFISYCCCCCWTVCVTSDVCVVGLSGALFSTGERANRDTGPP